MLLRAHRLPAWLHSDVNQTIETKILLHKFRIQKIFGKCWKWLWKRRTLIKIHSRVWQFMDQRFSHGIQWQPLPEEASAWWECRYKIKTHVIKHQGKKMKTHEANSCLRAKKNTAHLVPSYKFYISSISQIWCRRCQVGVNISFGHILAKSHILGSFWADFTFWNAPKLQSGSPNWFVGP